jgi:anthranilate synthase/aminodeoxychorismate synthase-like glutamine amidotransferase
VKPHVLLIDNYDSFTYNLVQQFQIEGADVTVRRNDAVTPDELSHLGATHLVVSPGPGRPTDAGISGKMVEAARSLMPVLGVCLGHQTIAHCSGLAVGPAQRLMHGKTSAIHHDGRGVFAGLPNPFQAGRYHSLAVVDARTPEVFDVTAWTEDGEVMGIRDRSDRVVGVQFHPESILTPDGPRLLSNFLGLTMPSRERPPLSSPGATSTGAGEGVS